MNRRFPQHIACLVLLTAASGCTAKPEFTVKSDHSPVLAELKLAESATSKPEQSP